MIQGPKYHRNLLSDDNNKRSLLSLTVQKAVVVSFCSCQYVADNVAADNNGWFGGLVIFVTNAYKT